MQLVKTFCFFLLLQIKRVITKTFNFKFENVSFTKLLTIMIMKNFNDKKKIVWGYMLKKKDRYVGLFFNFLSLLNIIKHLIMLNTEAKSSQVLQLSHEIRS